MSIEGTHCSAKNDPRLRHTQLNTNCLFPGRRNSDRSRPCSLLLRIVPPGPRGPDRLPRGHHDHASTSTRGSAEHDHPPAAVQAGEHQPATDPGHSAILNVPQVDRVRALVDHRGRVHAGSPSRAQHADPPEPGRAHQRAEGGASPRSDGVWGKSERTSCSDHSAWRTWRSTGGPATTGTAATTCLRTTLVAASLLPEVEGGGRPLLSRPSQVQVWEPTSSIQ